MQKTKAEIVDETITRILKDGRATEDRDVYFKRCFYLTPDGKRCAVGACFRPEVTEISVIAAKDIKIPLTEVQCNAGAILDFENLLKPEYRGHTINFWCRLQVLHDDITCWEHPTNPTKMTDYGLERANSLKTE